MNVQDAVIHDRQERRKLSRAKYAAAVGITDGRVHALEHGRRVKAGEIELLTPFIGDLLDPELVAETTDPVTTPRPNEDTEEQDASDFERTNLAYAYIDVMKRLGNNRIPPFNWPSQFRLETAPPIEFPAIRQWIQEVSRWLDEEDGVQPPPSEPEEIEVVTVEDEDEEQWEEVASVEVGDPDVVITPGVDVVPPIPPSLVPPVEEVAPQVGDEITSHATITPFGQPTPTELLLPEAPALVLDPNTWYVTNGERKTWLECQRRWMLESYHRLGKPTRKVTGAAAVGTRFHRALAAWYQPTPGDPWAVFNADVEADREYLDDLGASDQEKKDLESEIDLVRAMIEGYFEWIQETSADVGLKVVAPEAIIQANPQFPEFPHVRLLAKLDVRVVDERDQARWFIDHKSVQDFISAIRTLRMDEQMLHYHLIEWLKLIEEGLDTEIRAGGAYYNMARKVKRTATANPPFYAREPVKHNVEELRSYWQRVKATVIQMTEARAKLDAGVPHQEVCPPNPTRDCYWKCEFFTVCSMMDDNAGGAQAYMSEQLVEVNPLARYEPEAAGETV